VGSGYFIDSILHFSQCNFGKNNIWHIFNDKEFSIHDIATMLKFLGVNARKVSFENWVNEVRVFEESQDANLLNDLMPLIGDGSLIKLLMQHNYPKYSCQKTIEKNNISLDLHDSKDLLNYLKRFISSDVEPFSFSL
jgi:hypothetical protein